MNCFKCGKPMDEQDKNCPHCGAPNETAQAEALKAETQPEEAPQAETQPQPEEAPRAGTQPEEAPQAEMQPEETQHAETQPQPENRKKKPVLLYGAIAAAACAAAVFMLLPGDRELTGGGRRDSAAEAVTESVSEPAQEECAAASESVPESESEFEPESVSLPADVSEDSESWEDLEDQPILLEGTETLPATEEETSAAEAENETKTVLRYFLTEKREPRAAFSGVTAETLYDTEFVPASTSESPSAGLENVAQTELYFFTEEQKELLQKNAFFVTDSDYNEYYMVYEINRYDQKANFVTVDSLMHTYHLYFQHLLKSLERESLTEELSELTARMLQNSIKQYQALNSDEEWKAAAFRNVAFFSVAARLLSDEAVIPEEAAELAASELELISEASAVSVSPIMNCSEDYTQYKPRGYYAGEETLERYFRTMMWYGRMNFSQNEEQLNRSALLMTLAMNEDGCYKRWETIYAVTSFFAGKSDDLTYYEYCSAVREAYGEKIKAENLIENAESWERFCELTAAMEPPKINSLVVLGGLENPDKTKGLRFMGQRFSIDAAIFTRLLGFDTGKEIRTLPDALDIPAALGSEEALNILKEDGIERFSDYVSEVEKLRTDYSEENTELWQASLYSQWLYALKPLLAEKKEGYPCFMTGRAWTRKDLETFLGSYAELKHDTILYAKQVHMAEGDGDESWQEKEIIDDRGYVEPEYQAYARITALVKNTKAGLQEYGVLSEEDARNLEKLSILSAALMTISEKELKNEALTEDEYEIIGEYGMYLEEFWYSSRDYTYGDDYSVLQDTKAPVIADVATDNVNGQYLEVATGKPSKIYAAVPVDGELKIVSGVTFSFYEFSSNERLTDSQWRQMMGFETNEEGFYDSSEKKEHMSWTDCYREVGD